MRGKMASKKEPCANMIPLMVFITLASAKNTNVILTEN